MFVLTGSPRGPGSNPGFAFLFLLTCLSNTFNLAHHALEFSAGLGLKSINDVEFNFEFAIQPVFLLLLLNNSAGPFAVQLPPRRGFRPCRRRVRNRIHWTFHLCRDYSARPRFGLQSAVPPPSPTTS